jgi:hypothetical protein
MEVSSESPAAIAEAVTACSKSEARIDTVFAPTKASKVCAKVLMARSPAATQNSFEVSIFFSVFYRTNAYHYKGGLESFFAPGEAARRTFRLETQKTSL